MCVFKMLYKLYLGNLRLYKFNKYNIWGNMKYWKILDV